MEEINLEIIKNIFLIIIAAIPGLIALISQRAKLKEEKPIINSDIRLKDASTASEISSAIYNLQDIYQEMIKDLKSKVEEYKEEITNMRQRIEELEEENRTLKAQILELKDMVNKLKNKLESSGIELEI